MITLQKAIEIATDNAQQLIPKARNFNLESVLISDDDRSIEVALSYELHGSNGLDILQTNQNTTNSNMSSLANLLGIRREFKVFLVNAVDGVFRGFKKYKP